jgi:hypothetical protein
MRDKSTQEHVPRGTASGQVTAILGVLCSRVLNRDMLLPTTTEALLGKVLDTRR